MAGHSKWSSIKHKKAAVDAKRGKIFTKINKEITVAARLGGGDPDANPRLRTALAAAKAANMPQENIQRAIKKGTGELEGTAYEEVTYEGYGPGGVALLIECTTDNRNRTVGEIRALLGKNGGSMGESGCVSWIFEKKGFFRVPVEGRSEDDLLELVLEAGAEDLTRVDDHYEILCALENFDAVHKALEEAKVPATTAELTAIPKNTVPVDENTARACLKLLDLIDDHEDVQKVYSNLEIPDAVLAEIEQDA